MLPESTLSLVELEQFDPHATRHGQERRFCCPLPGCNGKRRDVSHRCLTVNIQTGAYHCHRCGSSGLLREFWQDKPQEPRPTRQQRTRRQWQQACALPPVERTLAPLSSNTVVLLESEDWRTNKRDLKPLADTMGAAYLAGRSIPLASALAARVRFSPCFYGRPAVVFPVRDAAGELTAMNGRYVDGDCNAKGEKRLTGRTCNRCEQGLKRGVFATSGAWNAPVIVIAEAPIDALSLAVAGTPALALCGTTLREWMLPCLAWKEVYLAFDNDPVNDKGEQPGEKAFTLWKAALDHVGAQTRRLRPEGAKDWNQMLKEQGDKALRRFLCTQLPYFGRTPRDLRVTSA
jgi:hypothetical protein